ncbi:MAG: hypothetical protein A3F77_16025 [Betaproteobacteria bacterium RIFCSPLOWO2_12_FULL_67_28]|nr:MAG: hypothetical protein A3F77_16025 [Betaproteobacteria bacterium RIFCSPLOWO2_12_FULL_67_28]
MSDPKERQLTYALTYRDVVGILRLVEESSRWESLELRLGDLKFGVRRASAAATASAASRAPASSAAIEASAQAETLVADGAVTLPSGTGLLPVCAPMLGTFYRAPAPGKPPFVQPGDEVDKDDTIGLIEVMKLFTQIPAGVAGRVVEIVAQDANLVECGQPLVLIDPRSGGHLE